MDAIDRLTATWSAEYLRAVRPVIDAVRRNLKAGDTAEEAVRKAFTAQDLDGRLANSLLDVLGVAAAEGFAPGARLKPEAREKLLSAPWTPDNTPLSIRLHKTGAVMRQLVTAEIQAALKAGENVRQLARRLYDGYGFGTTIEQAELPKYMDKIFQASRQMEVGRRSGRLPAISTAWPSGAHRTGH